MLAEFIEGEDESSTTVLPMTRLVKQFDDTWEVLWSDKKLYERQDGLHTCIICFLQVRSPDIVQQWDTCLVYHCFVKRLTDCTYKNYLQLKYHKLKVPVTGEPVNVPILCDAPDTSIHIVM